MEKETHKRIKDTAKLTAEDKLRIRKEAYLFFQDSFDKSMVFCGKKYDEMLLNLEHESEWGTKFDIVLINGDSIAIIDVVYTYKVASQDLTPKIAVDRIKKLRRLFPEFKKFKVYFGIASFSFSRDALKKAKECGICAIRRVGDHIEMAAANESIDNPCKSSDAAKECIKELELDRQISWADPRWGMYATSKQALSVTNCLKWEEEEKIDKQAKRFFRAAFAKNMVFDGIKYDKIRFNLGYNRSKFEVEFDIVLINGTSIAIIEVRNGIHPAFVQELIKKKVDKFRKDFPEYKNRKIYLGIAGFLFSKKIQEKAKKCGVGIIMREGNSMKMRTEKLKAY